MQMKSTEEMKLVDSQVIEQNQVIHALRTVSENLQSLIAYLVGSRNCANRVEMGWVKSQVKVDCDFLKELLELEK